MVDSFEFCSIYFVLSLVPLPSQKKSQLYGNDTNFNHVKDAIFGILKQCSEK